MKLIGIVAALVVTITSTAAASSFRARAGTEALLQGTGLHVRIPAGADWEVFPPDEFGETDWLARVEPGGSLRYGVVLRPSRVRSTTPQACDGFERQWTRVTSGRPHAVVPRPSWLPAVFHGTVAVGGEKSGSGAEDHAISACVPHRLGTLTVRFIAPMSARASEAELGRAFAPLAAEIARALAARDAVPRTTSPSTLVLTTAGVSATLPAGSASWRVATGAAGVDRIERTGPTKPRLAITLDRRQPSCPELGRVLQQRGYRPSFVVPEATSYSAPRTAGAWPFVLCFRAGAAYIIESESKLAPFDLEDAAQLIDAIEGSVASLPPPSRPAGASALSSLPAPTPKVDEPVIAAGASVTLPATGLTVVIPPGDRDWKVRMPLPFNAVDRLQVVTDWSRGLRDEFGISISVGRSTCAQQIDRTVHTTERIEPAPPWLAGFHPTIRVEDLKLSVPTRAITSCVPIARGSVWIRMSGPVPRGAGDDRLERTFGPLTSELRRSVQAREAAATGPGSRSLSLPVSGLTLALPGAGATWAARRESRGGAHDLITRRGPGATIDVHYLPVSKFRSCAAAMQAMQAEKLSELRDSDVSPPGWRAARSRLSGGWQLVLCTPALGSTVLVVESAVMVSGFDADDVRALLEAIERARTTPRPRPRPAPAPAPAPIRKSTPAPRRALHSPAPAVATSSSRGASPASSASSESDAWWSRSRFATFTGHQLRRNTATPEDSYGAGLAISLERLRSGDLLRFGWMFDLAASYDTSSKLMFDARTELGVFAGTTWQLGITAGLGVDGVGLGAGEDPDDPTRFLLPTRAYGSLAIRARWNFSRSWLDGAVWTIDRAGGPLDQELRATVQLVMNHRERSLGLEYVGYGDEARVIALRYGWRY